MEDYQRRVPEHGWPTSMLSTHDASRIAARVPAGQARVAAMLLMTQRGTPSHYYGDEVGMHGVDIPPERALDPQGRRTGRNRDPERTPMQWTADRLAGFTKAAPWLPIGADAATANVAVQRDDPRSLLTLYRRLIALRTEQPTLVSGAHVPMVRNEPLLTYRRDGDSASLTIVLNLGDEPRSCELDAPGGRVVLSTCLDRDGEPCSGSVELRGGEGVIIETRPYAVESG